MALFEHKPVLLSQTIEGLCIRGDGVYVDGTLGGGGHSEEILKRLKKGRLIGIDRDADAVAAATERLAKYGDKVCIVRDNYRNINSILLGLGCRKVDGILLDLGVSSYQLDEKDRGFSYMAPEERLDMRMDRSQKKDAVVVLNTYPEEELLRIFREYGEERFAARIAAHIAERRRSAPIEKAKELNAIIEKSIPARLKAKGGHPAKRIYQALRIEVNDELSGLSECIDEMIGFLAPGGRLCVITFHSLEDRIVKRAFLKNQDPCTCPKDLPVCVCNKKSKGKVITRKPITPDDKELAENSRSKSSKLRIFEKIRESREYSYGTVQHVLL